MIATIRPVSYLVVSHLIMSDKNPSIFIPNRYELKANQNHL